MRKASPNENEEKFGRQESLEIRQLALVLALATSTEMSDAIIDSKMTAIALKYFLFTFIKSIYWAQLLSENSM